MALSWNEVSPEQKIVYLLEGLVHKQEQQKTPIACNLCDKIFLDNRSLLSHFHSHCNRDGTLNPRSLVGNSVLPNNGAKFFSPKYTDSVSVSVNASNRILEPPTLSLGNHASPKIPQNSGCPTLTPGNHVAPKMPHNSGWPTLTLRPPSNPSPSIPRSDTSVGTFALRHNQFLNLNSPLISQPTGSQNSRSPINQITSGTQITGLNKFQFPSQHIQQSSFCFSGAFASQSTPSTDLTLSRETTKCADVAEGSLTGYAKPYILQLEKRTEQTMAGNNVGDNSNAEELDLTLKIG